MEAPPSGGAFWCCAGRFEKGRNVGNALIEAFERSVADLPDAWCFTYCDAGGAERSYSYAETAAAVDALSVELRAQGVRRGSFVVVDLPNCDMYVFLLLAAAREGFTIAALNNRLTAAEKATRVEDVERFCGPIALRIDDANVDALVAASSDPVAGASLDDCVVDSAAPAVIMFTSGTTGRPKAVPLTWENLCGSATASNAALSVPGEGLWQAPLPLFHVGGLQTVVRSILNGNPFALYRRFDADRLLRDASRWRATHIPVVDKTLQDLLASPHAAALTQYRCILLGGGALNAQTLRRAQAAHARVYASYGMTETCSQIANRLVDDEFDGGLTLLPGYRVRIERPDADGYGALAVAGPGVVSGYLNAPAKRTAGGFLLTGDTAALHHGRLYLRERTSDMFVSGGENVYPAEIHAKLVVLPGVSDAYVFGAPDPVWGRRPIAFVERAAGRAPSVLTPASIRSALARELSKISLPDRVFVLDEFPRTGIGKIDRTALRRRYDERIEVRRVTLRRIRLPFVRPFRTATATLDVRESIIVEVEDRAGRIGLGECVAFTTDWYLPETLGEDWRVLRDVLAPLLVRTPLLHPSEASPLFAANADAAAHPLACGAIEPALWDLYGQIVGQPLWQLIGGGSSDAPAFATTAGAVVGIGTPDETVAAVRAAVEAGYARVKLKVAPGGAPAVRAIRVAFPDLTISLDANRSFTENTADELRELDECGAAWIEEPLAPRTDVAAATDDLLGRLASLQRTMRTPICLDETITRPGDLARALAHPELRCYALKIAKLGGVQPALDFVRAARERGIAVWMGGMYDTGISKRLHAAFQALPGVSGAGDIGATARYFATDVTEPPYTAPSGRITLNTPGYEHGLGCTLNREALDRVTVERVVIE